MTLHGAISYDVSNRFVGFGGLKHDWMCIAGAPVSANLIGRWYSSGGKLRNWWLI